MTEPVFEWAVVGAGVHGTFLAMSVVRDLHVPVEKVLILDPAPQALATWDRRVRDTGMSHLRSPASHGLNATFPSLRRFASSQNRDEFVPPYHRPSISLFRAHAQSLVSHYLSHCAYRQDQVCAIEELPTGYLLHGAKQSYAAHAVILAPGQPEPRTPRFAVPILEYPQIGHIFAPSFDLSSVFREESVAIVGGGLSGSSLALSLTDKMRSVTLFSRGPRRVSQFDSDPCFIGTKCGKSFAEVRDPAVRRTIIVRERNNGSVPPDIARRMVEAERQGLVTLVTDEVTTVQKTDGAVTIESSRQRFGPFRRVVLATGFEPGPPAHALVRQIADNMDLPLAPDGYPLPDRSMRWGKNLYLSGALGELEIGPPARNIIGAHLTRRRILASLGKTYPSSISSSSVDA